MEALLKSARLDKGNSSKNTISMVDIANYYKDIEMINKLAEKSNSGNNDCNKGLWLKEPYNNGIISIGSTGFFKEDSAEIMYTVIGTGIMEYDDCFYFGNICVLQSDLYSDDIDWNKATVKFVNNIESFVTRYVDSDYDFTLIPNTTAQFILGELANEIRCSQVIK